MANALYNKGRQGFLDGSIDWDTDTIKDALTDHGADTPAPTTDQFLSDISAGTVATSGAYTTKTVTDGVADADDVVHATVSGASIESVNIFKDTGVAGTSRLIAYIDTATGLPVTPNGGDITLVFDSGANKIFKL